MLDFNICYVTVNGMQLQTQFNLRNANIYHVQ